MYQHVVDFEGGPMRVPFRARLVTKGMGYGRWDVGACVWAVKHERDQPVVEFYDLRFAHTPHGQFVSRYFLQTLADRDPQQGLLLDTGSPDWHVGGDELEAVLQKLKPVAHARSEQLARGLVLLLSNRGNPDRAQDPTFPILSAPDDMQVPVSDLGEASALSRHYIEAFDLGGGNWTGGRVVDSQGRVVASVSYNGRVFGPDGGLLQEASPPGEYSRPDEQWFFERGPSPAVVETAQVSRGQRMAG